MQVTISRNNDKLISVCGDSFGTCKVYRKSPRVIRTILFPDVPGKELVNSNTSRSILNS